MSGCGSGKGCGGCPLKLVETRTPLKDVEARNFWNTCPRKLELMPDEPCPMGRPEKNEKGKLVKEPECPWWIDSEKDNYCFWRYLQNNSLPDGKMDSQLQNEIADKFACSSTKIHFILKEAVEKLKDSEYLDVLSDLAEEDPKSYGTPEVPMDESKMTKDDEGVSD